MLDSQKKKGGTLRSRGRSEKEEEGKGLSFLFCVREDNHCTLWKTQAGVDGYFLKELQPVEEHTQE